MLHRERGRRGGVGGVLGTEGGPEAHSPDIQVEKPPHSREAPGQAEHGVQGQAVLAETAESQGRCYRAAWDLETPCPWSEHRGAGEGGCP